MISRTRRTDCPKNRGLAQLPKPVYQAGSMHFAGDMKDSRQIGYIRRMTDAHEQVALLADLLVGRSQMLAVAESCTGGWVAKCLTDLAGCSCWFDRGFVTYTNAAKQDMLGVPEATLRDHGAVSEDTVLAMAEGVLAHSNADVALAISGIAGPGGAVAGKPVGTVCFAWAIRPGYRQAETCRFEGGRDAVRHQAVVHALARLVRILQDD